MRVLQLTTKPIIIQSLNSFVAILKFVFSILILCLHFKDTYILLNNKLVKSCKNKKFKFLKSNVGKHKA